MSFFGQGGFAQNLTGLLGDVFLQQGGMQPVYGPTVKQRQQAELEEQQRQRKRLEGREDTKWEWENKPKDPYIPDAEKQAKYYESIGDFDTAKDIRDRVGLIPVQRVNQDTQNVEAVYVRPGMLTDGNANLPRISTPAEAAKLPPGTPFIAPDGSRRKTPGGAAPSSGPGMFPRPY